MENSSPCLHHSSTKAVSPIGLILFMELVTRHVAISKVCVVYHRNLCMMSAFFKYGLYLKEPCFFNYNDFLMVDWHLLTEIWVVMMIKV